MVIRVAGIRSGGRRMETSPAAGLGTASKLTNPSVGANERVVPVFRFGETGNVVRIALDCEIPQPWSSIVS